MCTYGKKIDIIILRDELQLPEALYIIHMEKASGRLLLYDLTCLQYGLYCSDLVIYMHDRDQKSIRRKLIP